MGLLQNAVFRPEQKIYALKELVRTAVWTVLTNFFFDLIFQNLILQQRHYEALLRYEEPFAAECYGLMSRMCYRPKAIVEYQRKAFIAKENRIRITLDHHIIATESRLDLFAPDLNLYPVLDPFSAVLEVKYNGFLLSYIKAAVNGADRSELSVSKYCLARSAGLHYQM